MCIRDRNAMVALGDDSEEAFNVAKAGLSDAYSVVRASACELSLSLKLKERILRLENEIIELTKRKEELEQRGDEETKAEMEKLSSQIQFLCEKRKRLSEAQSEISRKVIALLGDKKPLVQNAAAKSLREFVTEENLEQITGALKDAPEDMLCEIIWMYAGIGTEKALNLIAEKFLSSDDPDIKAEAACALASKGDARGIKEIKELLLGRTDPFRKIQLLRLLVRNKIYLEDVTTAVEQLLDSPEERLKSEAEKALKLLRSEKEGGKKGN
ncbi:MAG: hypothetical protein N2234_06610, partial [Planctomycetota bacterium]|nr:hypothetical protein [Planctomycetota bacterium]